MAWFGLNVSLDQLSTLMEGGKETVIGELETLAVAMALLLWAKHLDSTQLLVYIDNEGSRYSLIKGYSVSRSITAICALAATTLDAHYVLPWFGRIPSVSNLADFPSRQLKHPLLTLDAEVPKEEVEAMFESSIDFVRKASSPQWDGWGPWRKRRQDFPHLSRKKGECALLSTVLQFVLCGFRIFSARCFSLWSLRIHDGVFRMYIYIHEDIYIYTWFLFVTFMTSALARINKRCDVCPLVF